MVDRKTPKKSGNLGHICKRKIFRADDGMACVGMTQFVEYFAADVLRSFGRHHEAWRIGDEAFGELLMPTSPASIIRQQIVDTVAQQAFPVRGQPSLDGRGTRLAAADMKVDGQHRRRV
ncbi:MAG: hypothetical protein RLN87_06315 [Parasphingopyxis sp.]|uniref:hypothetical protein n=1 Tax=Parasphingopyxis sp. TaxID=1920299 RepID=UPI0032EB9653